LSGPVSDVDADPTEANVRHPDVSAIEVYASRTADVAGESVKRALPRRARRTVGAWCFLDHFGPHDVTPKNAMMVGPHPHIGLQTVTWLLAGEAVHTDSLGSEQLIRAGQVNLMSAGNGVAHAEDGRDRPAAVLHGVQLWIAQPAATRTGSAAFEHHAEPPRAELENGTATVLVGEFGGLLSPARADSPLVGVDLDLAGPVTFDAVRAFEYAVVVLLGAVRIEGTSVRQDELAYLGTGREQIALTAERGTRALLLGGEPFAEPILMWWNFVARSRDEIERAYGDWHERTGRFGDTRSTLDPMPIPRPPWMD